MDFERKVPLLVDLPFAPVHTFIYYSLEIKGRNMTAKKMEQVKRSAP